MHLSSILPINGQIPMIGVIQMGKSVKAEIVLPHGVSIKADKLADRTIRTVKVGDYLPTSLNVRGTECTFYARVTEVMGRTVHTVFGSENWPHVIEVPRTIKVDVYRPIN